MAVQDRWKVRNREWNLHVRDDGTSSYEAASLNVLQDIRDEIRAVRQLLECPNTMKIPQLLRMIERHVRKKPKLRAVKKRRAA